MGSQRKVTAWFWVSSEAEKALGLDQTRHQCMFVSPEDTALQLLVRIVNENK